MPIYYISQSAEHTCCWDAMICSGNNIYVCECRMEDAKMICDALNAYQKHMEKYNAIH